jgi:hypothetical protein
MNSFLHFTLPDSEEEQRADNILKKILRAMAFIITGLCSFFDFLT